MMRTFYILILTQTFSQVGSKISSLAVAIWMFAETGNATPIALTAFFMTLPSVLATVASALVYALPVIRNLEVTLPDYVAEAV
jgi:MFS transporter, DHA3 family, macrolide efflux protein